MKRIHSNLSGEKPELDSNQDSYPGKPEGTVTGQPQTSHRLPWTIKNPIIIKSSSTFPRCRQNMLQPTHKRALPTERVGGGSLKKNQEINTNLQMIFLSSFLFLPPLIKAD